MKKRILLILFIMIICMAFGGCGGASSSDSVDSQIVEETEGTDSKATIVTNEGDEVEMTAQELMDAYDGNEASFAKIYEGAKITFTGTISTVKLDTDGCIESGSICAHLNKIVFEEGWCVVIQNDSPYDLANYNPGDKYIVTTAIFGSPYDTEALKDAHGDSRVVFLVGDGAYGLYNFVTIDYGVKTTIEATE
jgi:hypothetical protein